MVPHADRGQPQDWSCALNAIQAPLEEPTFTRRLIGRASIGRYAVIGVSGILVDGLMFILLIHFGVAPVLATIFSNLAAILNNYVLNSKFNFRVALALGSGVRYLAVGLLGLPLSALTLQVLIHAGLTPIAAKAISIPIVVIPQFAVNKYWSFRTPARLRAQP